MMNCDECGRPAVIHVCEECAEEEFKRRDLLSKKAKVTDEIFAFFKVKWDDLTDPENFPSFLKEMIADAMLGQWIDEDLIDEFSEKFLQNMDDPAPPTW